jgi:hypothetical protein
MLQRSDEYEAQSQRIKGCNDNDDDDVCSRKGVLLFNLQLELSISYLELSLCNITGELCKQAFLVGDKRSNTIFL